jgi:hypothetical protein
MYKKIIWFIVLAAFLSFIFPLSIFADDEKRELDCEESKIKGELNGKEYHSSGGMIVAGVSSGILLGLIGTGIIVAVAAGTHPQPDFIPNEDIINESCYISGYSDSARKKNIYGALGGGLVGTAIIVTVIAIASTSSN